MVIAQPVIEKIALPVHAVLSGDELLPVLHRRFHPGVTRERNNCMQMIRHKQAQPAMPDASLVVEFRGREHGVPISARHNWFLPLGTQLMVMKNQLPSATHCGIV